jgi:D-alanyl-D-alanine carboxypeptidase/D-alanyl-D-alanine-endopeptidase (penicillin-binding protein 4)
VAALLLVAGGAGIAQSTAQDTAVAQPPGTGALRTALAGLVTHGGVAVGEDGRTRFRFGEGRYVPASIVKLATALAAFHQLGPDYRFRTEVYRGGAVLYLRGYGDPYLVSEEWALLAGRLADAGVFAEPLEALVLDMSALAGELDVDGAADSLNPYDARLGALVSNFNTVFVDVGAAGGVHSAEPQTPLTPLAYRMARGLPPGEHRINLTARGVPGWQYSGELAQALFSRAGARFAGPSRAGRVPPGSAPLLVYRSSRTLREVVAGMMEFSNNFIANQIVLAMALESSGEPATLAAGMEQVRRYLSGELGLSGDRFTLVEGSGLSRNNSIELEAMLAVVDAFHPWAALLKPYGKTPYQVPAKTGTLSGVYSLAGFLPAPAGSRRPFVIMLNQPRHTRAQVYQRVAAAFAGPNAAGGVSIPGSR